MKKLILLSITLLVLNCTNMKKENNTGTENRLASQVDYGDKVQSKIYYEGETYKMILFALTKAQLLKPHSAPMDTPLLMLEGEAKIIVDERTYILKSGESIVLPKNVDHAVYAISDIKFILIK